MSLNRRQFIQASLASSLSLGFMTNSHGQEHNKKEKPLNILLVVTDQERARHLLPSQLSLPAHDRLKQMGVTFNNAQVVTSLCSMSRGTIYTGQHQQFNGMWENTPLPHADGLSKSTPTLGHMFSELGYHTGYFGKWHLNKLPLGEAVGKETMQQLLAEYGFQESAQDREIDGPLEGHIWDPKTIAATQDFITTHKKDEKPWFAAVNLVNPHDIMFYAASKQQPESRWSKFPHPLASAPSAASYQTQHQLPLLKNFGQENWQQRPAAHKIFDQTVTGALGKINFSDHGLWQNYQDYYFNCLQDMDTQLQGLLDTLDETQSWQDTLVVFTSDHGELLGAHHLRDKGPVIYQDCNNVPMIVVHPDGNKDQATSAITSHIDIAPTLLEFAGVDENLRKEYFPNLLGHSFAQQVFDSQKTSAREACLYQWSSLVYLDNEFAKNLAPVMANKDARSVWNFVTGNKLLPSIKNRCHFRGSFDGRYKFARYFSPTQHRQTYSYQQLLSECDLELYDTLNDPLEQYNLAKDTTTYKELIIEKNQLLETLITAEIGSDLGEFLPGPSSIWAA